MMSRKNYIKFASIYNTVIHENKNTVWVINQLIRYFKEDNPNFDETRFKDACALEALE